MKNELKWEITPKERKTRLRQIVFMFIPMIIGYFLALFLGEGFNLKIFLYSVFFSIIGCFIFLFINWLLPYKQKSYLLRDNNLIISVGNKTREYSWDEFEYFSSSRKFKGSPFFVEKRKISGDVYYLRKRSKGLLSRFSKVFTVIYSEPENDREVFNFLSHHLPQKEKITDEIGLIFYEFKDTENIISLMITAIILTGLIIGFLFITSKKSPIEELKMKDLRIVLTMEKINVKASSLFFEEESGYTLLDCDYDNAMRNFCNDIKKETGVKPTIYSNKEEFCAYIKLTLPYERGDDYYCIDSHGNSGYTINPAPKEGGGCDGKTFNCVNIRKTM